MKTKDQLAKERYRKSYDECCPSQKRVINQIHQVLLDD